MSTGNINSKIDEQHVQLRLEQLYLRLEERAEYMIGYPINKKFDYSELYRFLKFPVNNVGDPFVPSNLGVNTLDIEREVLEFFAKLLRAPENNWWGYVTNGGSEGNLYGLFLARECLPDAMFYYSSNTHYSVHKNLKILNVPAIAIRTQQNGEMDYDDLREQLKLHRHKPAVIFANTGTTMTEAKDDISVIRDLLDDLAIQDNYIHSDAALSGMINPFVDGSTPFDFMDGADSISISGHKFLGSPVPCGVVIAKASNRNKIGSHVSYIDTQDTTITGSRNGISPLFLWYAIQKLGYDGIKERVLHSLEVADYAEKQLNAIGVPAWRNKDAITVIFPKPDEVLVRKWQLATHKKIAHMICMPDITKEKVDLFIRDFKNFSSLVEKTTTVNVADHLRV